MQSIPLPEEEDATLEYFPNDGYDYNQHFVTKEKRIGFTSFFIEPENVKAKLNDPVFRGTLEKPLEEMDEDELDVLRELQSDADDNDDVLSVTLNKETAEKEGTHSVEEYETFLETLLPKGRTREELTKQSLWGSPLWFERNAIPLTEANLERVQIGLDDPHIVDDKSRAKSTTSGSQSEEGDTQNKLRYDDDAFEKAVRGLDVDDDMSDYSDVNGAQSWEASDKELEAIRRLNLIAEDVVEEEATKLETLKLEQIKPLDAEGKKKTLELIEQQSSGASDLKSDDFNEDNSHIANTPHVHFMPEAQSRTLPPPKRVQRPKTLSLNDLL